MSHFGEELDAKHTHLRSLLEAMGSVLVAFSGGVDSTLLLRVALDVLNGRALAVTAHSATTARQELEEATRLGQALGAHHLVVAGHELENPEFAKNPENKCYLCKKSRFTQLLELAQERGVDWVIEGSNVDDRLDYRPGRLAIEELGIRSPLSEAALTKAEIRELSRRLGLRTWDQPSAACLASRIPYGSPITAEKLRQVDEGEELLRSLGFTGQVRIRHHGDTARIEIASANIPRLVHDAVRARVVTGLKELGFSFVTLDLEGYSMGSLNRVLEKGR